MIDKARSQALGRAVHARRKALGLTQADVRALDGPSTANLRNIERGDPLDLQVGTTYPLERILGWPNGSIRAYLNGVRDDLPEATGGPDYRALRRRPAAQVPTDQGGVAADQEKARRTARFAEERLDQLLDLVDSARLMLEKAMAGTVEEVIDRARRGEVEAAALGARLLLDQVAHNYPGWRGKVKIERIGEAHADQEAEPIEDSGGTAGGREGGSTGSRGAPIDPSPESMSKLRELADGVTTRSRQDPRSG